jgi:hypothetical protein
VQQRGQPRPIDRLEPDLLPDELALQPRELVTQRQDLDVLVTVAARQQPQQRERVRNAQVRQPQQHEAASSRTQRCRGEPARPSIQPRPGSDVRRPSTSTDAIVGSYNVVHRRMPLRDAAEVHRIVTESTHIGKVFLTTG